MAEKTAQTFVNDLENSSSLSSQFYAASPNNFEAVVDFAISRGYVFTKDELVEAIKRHPEGKIAQQLRQFVH